MLLKKKIQLIDLLRNKFLLQFPYFGKFPIKIFPPMLRHKQKIFIQKFPQNLEISLRNLLRNKSNIKLAKSLFNRLYKKLIFLSLFKRVSYMSISTKISSKSENFATKATYKITLIK